MDLKHLLPTALPTDRLLAPNVDGTPLAVHSRSRVEQPHHVLHREDRVRAPVSDELAHPLRPQSFDHPLMEPISIELAPAPIAEVRNRMCSRGAAVVVNAAGL